MSREFIFEKVILLKPYWFVVIALLIAIPIFLLMTFYSINYLALAFGIIIGLMYVILKICSKTVTISFTDADVIFKVNGRVSSYPKIEFAGFYSFDYSHTKNCGLSMNFRFKDGREINISDYKLDAAKYNAAKHQILIEFINTAKQQLDFEAIAQNKWKTRLKLGNTWFSRADKSKED